MKKLSQKPIGTVSTGSSSILKKKQYGFTIAELMVVIGIIALLSSMGAQGYTGYLKGVRDTQRMTDIANLDTIIFEYRRTHGRPPASQAEYEDAVKSANNGQLIVDPLDKKPVCLADSTLATPDYCSYLFYTCDNQTGYILSTKFEKTDNVTKYTRIDNKDGWYFNSGACSSLDLPAPQTVLDPNSCRIKADCATNSVCVGPTPRTCKLKSNQNAGADCDIDADCQTNNCHEKSKKCKNN